MNILSEQDLRRQELYALLGDLPRRDGPITARLVEQSERDGYRLEKLVLELNGSQPVPAYFVKPIKSSGRLPCLLYNHAHAGDYRLGKDELLLGRPELSARLTRRRSPRAAGRRCASMPGSSANAADVRNSEVFKEMLWKGQVLWGRMVYDSLRALDYLAAARTWMPTGSGRSACRWAARWPGGWPRWTSACGSAWTSAA